MRFGSFSGRTIAIAAWALAVLAPSSALATDGFGPLNGQNGCLVAPDQSSSEQGTSRCGTGKGLYGASAVAVSPDGTNVYVAGGVAGADVAKSYGAVAILKRDPASGSISEVNCLSSDGTDHRDGASGACAPEPSLLGADGVAVSPDGKTVYVSSSSSASIVAFSRDPATGGLTRLGCFQGTPRPGAPCGSANLFSSTSSPLVSANGGALYVAAPLSGAVSALDASDRLRTPTGIVSALPAAPSGASESSTATGTGSSASADSSTSSPDTTSSATPASPTPSVSAIFTASIVGDELLNPCIAVNGLDGTCSVGVATDGLGELALSPDGKQVYGAAPESAAIDVFAPAAGGGLSETRCVMRSAPHGLCSSDQSLSKPGDLAVSPDGKNVYAADTLGGYSGDKVDVLSRDATTGALTSEGCVQFAPKPEPKGEEEESGESEEEEDEEEAKPAPKGKAKGKRARAADAGGCSSSAAGLANVDVVAVSGDGSSVYAIGGGSAAIFTRNPATGALNEASCAENEDPRCTNVPTLKGVSGAAISPDGHQVYVVSQGSDAVMVFGIGAAVTTGNAAASRTGLAHVSVACPAGLRRACSGRLQLTRAVARAARHGRRHRHGSHRVHVRRVTVGRSGSFSIAPGAHASVGVRLSQQMRRLLARRHRLRLMAVVRANPAAGGSGYGRHVTLALARR